MSKVKLCVLAFLSLLCVVAIFCACNPIEKPLDTPQNLVLDDEEMLSWNAVEGAEFYVVTVGETEYETEETQMDLFDILVDPGEVTISVTAYPADFGFQSESAQITVDSKANSEGLVFAEIDNGASFAVKAADSDSVYGKLVIPKTHNGLPVTQIVAEAFDGCNNLTAIVIPNSVSKIFNAFSNCAELTRIRWCGATTVSLYEKFENCAKLSRIDFSEGTEEFAVHAWSECVSLNTLTLTFPSSLRTLDGRTFQNLPNLENIVISDDNPYLKSENGCVVETSSSIVLLGTCDAVIPQYAVAIADFAFMKRNIKSIFFPENIKSIGRNAFFKCEKLEKMEFSKGAPTWYYNAFDQCIALSSLSVDKNNPDWKSEGNCVIEKQSNALILGCSGSVIPNYVTKIGEAAFYGSGIETIKVPVGCNEIASKAFSYCKKLKVVMLPNGLETIGAEAFLCSYPTSLTIPESVISIGSLSFGSPTEIWLENKKYIDITLYYPFEKVHDGWEEYWWGGFGFPSSLCGNCEYGYDEDYPYVQSAYLDRVYFGISCLLLAPQREGYEFVGWSTENNATESDDEIHVEEIEGRKYVVFEGKWKNYVDTRYCKFYAVWKKI